jgi:hypothetical protein
MMSAVSTRRRGASGHRGGFTILEAVFYFTLLLILGIPLIAVTMTLSRSSAEGDMFSRILERNRSMLYRIAAEYRNSLRATTIVSPDGKSLEFTSNDGCDGTGPVDGAVIRYEIRLHPTETANGADDNHNGLIDESILVRVNQTKGEEVVLLSGLDTGTSSFAGVAGGVNITLTTSGLANRTGPVMNVQRSLTVYARS